MAQKRKDTDKKTNNNLNILEDILKKDKNIKFGSPIQKKNGSARLSIGKLNESERIIYMSNSEMDINLINLTENSLKCDFSFKDQNNQIYYIEAKSKNKHSDVLSEFLNITKSKKQVENYVNSCKKKGIDYKKTYDQYISNIILYKKRIIDLYLTILPHFFTFHKDGVFEEVLTKEEFLSKYEIDLIFKPDAGGKKIREKYDYEFKRLTVVYKLKHN